MFSRTLFLSTTLLIAAVSAACSHADADAPPARAEQTAGVPVTTTIATARPVRGVVSVSGTLTAEDDAEIAAEVAGRVVSTAVERGSRVEAGAELVRISDEEAKAQATEAQANADQIAARLGIADGAMFDVERVPEVANAKAAFELAQTDFARAESLQQQLLLSKSDFDQRRQQKDAAARQYDTARNGAAQQYQQLIAARARVLIARKAVNDTVVRAPFAGVVGERFVSAGDYVTRGARAVSVLRIDPLRVQLTVTEQDVSAIGVGRPVSFSVDAYPGETFEGVIRYIAPAVTADTRALTVEAVVPNRDGRLRPGFFATARIQRQEETQRILLPAGAIRAVNDTRRVFVLDGDRARERVVTVGQKHENDVEVLSGLTEGERVITSDVGRLVDGLRVAGG